VRKNGKAVDPFSTDGTTDCKASDRSLWQPQAHKDLAYKGTDLLQLQWASRVYDADEISTGPLPTSPPKGDESALVLYAQVINLHKDDVVNLKVSIPGEEPVVNSVVMKRNRALQQLHAGKKMRGAWPTGNYVGRFEVVRNGGVVVERELRFARP
jgi:hypothetical protein